MLTGSTRFAPNSAEIAADDLDGEVVFINLSNGMYYSMVGSGGFVWGCFERGLSVDETVASLAAHYEVGAMKAENDIRALADDLLRERLLLLPGDTNAPVKAADAPVGADDAPAQRQPYETPQLNVYSDMQALLALDPPMPDLTDAPWKSSKEAA